MPLAPLFVALDCETTGFDSRTDKIIEVGAVKFTLAENVAEIEALANPGVRIPAVVARLTGIRDEELATAPKFETIRDEFAEFCRDAILIGHNLPFDLGFLKSHGLDLTSYPSFDTFDLANLILPREISLALENLAEKFGLLHTDAHRAKSDAEATRDLFRLLVSRGTEFDAERWEKVRTLKLEKGFWLGRLAELINDKKVVEPAGLAPASPVAKASVLLHETTAPCSTTTAEHTKIARTEQASFAATEEMNRSSHLLSNNILSSHDAQSQDQDQQTKIAHPIRKTNFASVGDVERVAQAPNFVKSLTESEHQSEIQNLKSKIEILNSPVLLETVAAPEAILESVKESSIPIILAFPSSHEAQKFAAAQNLPALFAPESYVCAQRVKEFSARKLTPAESVFAAKLILHAPKSFGTINLTRTERLLAEFVACENCSPADCEFQTLLAENSERKILVTNHTSLPSLTEFESIAHRKLILLNALKLPFALTRAETLMLDLATLEALAPEHASSSAITWGLLGCVYRAGAAAYGRLDLATMTNSDVYRKFLAAGKNLLATLAGNLPPRVTHALTRILAEDPTYSGEVRSNSLEEITLVITPKSAAEKIRTLVKKFSGSLLTDLALATSGGNFSFAKKQLGLAEDTPAYVIPNAIPLPRINPINTLPAPAEPRFAGAMTHYLADVLPTLNGRSLVVLGNHLTLAETFAKLEKVLPFPVLADKFSENRAQNLRTFAEQENVAYLVVNAQMIPPRTQNLFLARLPFFVRSGADFSTETLPASVLEFKSLFRRLALAPEAPAEQTLFVLDRRITKTNYGKEFLGAIE